MPACIIYPVTMTFSTLPELSRILIFMKESLAVSVFGPGGGWSQDVERVAIYESLVVGVTIRPDLIATRTCWTMLANRFVDGV